MDYFLDIHQVSLNRQGEELCGDQVKILRTPEKTIIVLSDGLGSGVKANILATLTTEIILTMLKEDISLQDVIETVIGTLPTCSIRKIAYATFSILVIQHSDASFQIINFDNPSPYFFKQGKLCRFSPQMETILGKKIEFSEGVLGEGDFIGLVSDGALYAGLGVTMNFGWGWENVGRYIEELFSRRVFSAHSVVNSIIAKSRALYGGNIGDDATVVGIYARKRDKVMIFTGPPLDESHDHRYVEQLMQFDGKKIVCGGTTGNIVASITGQKINTLISTLREDIPPIGELKGVDLVTEGIITMARALEYLNACKGDLRRLPEDKNGAYLLTREILLADAIYFLVGQQINPFYQNPLLPKNISIRRFMVEQMAEVLTQFNKEVHIEYC